MIHDLKCATSSFRRIVDGTKTFEIRRDDRGYQMGDVLLLREWKQDELVYTGAEVERIVGVVFRQGFGVDLGEFVVMALLHPSTTEAVA